MLKLMEMHAHKPRDKWIWPWRATLCPRMIIGKEALPPRNLRPKVRKNRKAGQLLLRRRNNWRGRGRVPTLEPCRGGEASARLQLSAPPRIRSSAPASRPVPGARQPRGTRQGKL